MSYTLKFFVVCSIYVCSCSTPSFSSPSFSSPANSSHPVNDALVHAVPNVQQTLLQFVSAVLCSCDWCTRCWMSPRIFTAAGLTSVLFGGHRFGGIKAHIFTCLVLLKDEEIAWQVAHHGQLLLWQEHVAVIAAVDLHFRIDKEVCEVKLWDADGYHTRSTKRRPDVMLMLLMYSIYPRANLVTKSYDGCAMRVVFNKLQNCPDFRDGVLMATCRKFKL